MEVAAQEWNCKAWLNIFFQNLNQTICLELRLNRCMILSVKKELISKYSSTLSYKALLEVMHKFR